MDKEISEDYLVKNLRQPSEIDPPSEIERKNLVISSTMKIVTLKVASKYMQK